MHSFFQTNYHKWNPCKYILPYSSENFDVEENESRKRKNAGEDDSKPVDVKPEKSDEEIENTLTDYLMYLEFFLSSVTS